MKHISTFLLLFLSFVAAFAQNTYSVCNIAGFPANFTDLQTAINTVPNGSILLVQGSPNGYGNVTVNKPIIIRGSGYFLTQNSNTQVSTNPSTIGDIIFDNGSGGSQMSGMTTGSVTLDSVNNMIIYSNKIISGCYGSSCFIAQYCQNLTIKHNFFAFNSGNCGLFSCNNSLIHNNIFQKCGLIVSGGYQTQIYNNSWYYDHIPYVCNGYSINVDCNLYNNIYSCLTSYIPNQTNNNVISDGSTYFSGSSAFYNLIDAYYQLAPGSNAIGAGVGGVDCGAFGGNDPYKLSGITTIPNMYYLDAFQNVNSSGILNVHIKVKTNN